MAENEQNGTALGRKDPKVMTVITDKKAVLAWRLNHDLHVALIMKRHSLTKAQAIVQAYAEGVDGLNRRLE